ncbi:MAG: adenylate/guanylate cyclase domain-containing protein [Vicinamibacterales bacterium]
MVKCPGCGEENPPKFKLCGYCGTPLAAASPALPVREMRKTVTVIFCDLKDSTALGERLDSEALHEVKERYFGAMSAEILRHGGKIEKFIGDAIMAVFGLPRAHEDDALRALRAAIGMRTALARVNVDLATRYGVQLANRTGLNTGEVVANDDPTADQKLATGDAVNVAARLEQAAPAGEIFLGETTYRLARDAIEVEAVDPLQLKGKTEPVAAYRLVSASGLDGHVRRADIPTVGRDDELAALDRAWHELCARREVRLFTIVGDAGQGKSHLARAVIERIATGAVVLRGRCLPYGDGVTFWPLVGMVWGAADILEEDAPELARSKILATVGDAEVADRLASAIGLSKASFPMQELNWAARRFLTGLAARSPVVALVDDIHWAEHAFLEMLEHILETATDAPVLILATARHELYESHPQWGDKKGGTRLDLLPLTDAASAQVVTNLLKGATLQREALEHVIRAAEGNPLYIEQTLSMLIDGDAIRQQGDAWVTTPAYGAVKVPPTIQALLEARLDNLPRADRATVEPAAVIGLEFARPALEALAPDAVRASLPEHLGTLVRKHFIKPSSATHADAIYRFHNHLVRETVYNGLLKRARANLHIGFVGWADKINADRDRALEFEEILGYHLEQAHRYLRELGPLDEAGLAIGRDAAGRLGNAARRAHARGDMHAAASLFRRATAMLAADAPQRIDMLPDLAEALLSLGDYAGARAVLEDASDAARRIGNRRIEAACQLIGLFVSLHSGEQEDWADQALRSAQALIPVLEAENAHGELANAWRLIVLVHGMAGQYRLANEAAERSIAHARHTGNERLLARNGLILAISALYSPMPVPQAIAQCEAMIGEGIGDRQVEGSVLCTLSQLKAMNGQIDQAREHYRRGRAMLRELGQGVNAASTGLDLARAELHGGDLALAEREVRADYDFLTRMGETYFLSTMAALLARLVRDQGRDGEALEFTQVAEGATSDDDVESQALWRSIRAPVVARAGDVAQGEELARAAVELARGTEAPMMLADALAELAEVLRIAGRPDEARQAMDEAMLAYGSKGDVVSAARCTAWAAELARA